MKALNIKKFIEEGIDVIEAVPKNSFTWDDIVTGTKYYLKLDDYNMKISNLFNDIKNLNYDEIVKFFNNNDEFNFLPWKEAASDRKPLFIDVLKLYVLFACIFDGADKINREKIYVDFITSNYSFKNAYKIITYIAGKEVLKEDEKLLKELKVILVKGGAFKVKKYFLENNKLKDMRGASALLTYVTENNIPQLISNQFINEALIYSGGGNVMCIVPDESIATKLCCEFEKSFNKYTLTVENAFSYYECDLYNFIENYKYEMKKLEAKIENRKKLKIYSNVTPKSQLNNKKECISLNNNPVFIESIELKGKEEICYLCSKRNSLYSIKENDKLINICGSCLHKHLVGIHEKIGYNNKIKKYIRKKYHKQYNFKDMGSIDEIDAENKKIAVIYGDGNNIGAIIQNIENIFEMMYFSKKIQNAANEAVYEAIFKNCNGDKQNIFKFEIIAVGGDDIFFIVPASKVLGISKDLIDIFNNQFINKTSGEQTNKYNATMSIGIAISKADNDIRNLVEIAQKELKIAKDRERKLLLECNNSGSVSIDFVKGSNYLSKESVNNENNEIKYSMFPMSNDTFKDILKIILKIKQEEIKYSTLTRIEEATKKMDLDKFMLFYLYNETKTKKRLMKIFEENKVALYNFDKGLLIESKKAKIYYPWSDILELWKFVEKV